MKTYQDDSCNNLYIQALKDCLALTSPTSSRVGLVYDLGPAIFEFAPQKPNFLTLKSRALNPFFAIAEAAWIIGGENRLDILNYYLRSYDEFSDDGLTLNGAYGFRLKQHFGFDQIKEAINELKESPNSRRCILNMHSPNDLKNKNSKDIPCNTSIMLKLRDGALDITIINRSNDIHFGLPYNLFVFQTLHCYLAKKIGVKLGYQRHFTDSLHLYDCDIKNVKKILEDNETQHEIFIKDNFDLINMILNEFKNINARNFNSIKEIPLRETMVIFESYKNNKKTPLIKKDTENKLLNFLINEWASKYSTK